MTTEAVDHQKENTHLMIVDHPEPLYTGPLYFTSLKDAADKADEIIKEHPAAECDIYQIRTRLRGKVEIMRQDYNSSKSD